MDVADQNRPGEVIGEPTEPGDPGEQEARPDEQCERRGELRRLAASRHGEWQQRSAHECRDRPLRADDELPRRPEEGVENRRQEQCIEAVHGRDAGYLGIRHRGRDRESGDSQAGEEIAARRVRPVPGDLGTDREGPLQQRILSARAERRSAAAIRDRRWPFGSDSRPVVLAHRRWTVNETSRPFARNVSYPWPRGLGDPWHCFHLRPDPQEHGSLRPRLASSDA